MPCFALEPPEKSRMAPSGRPVVLRTQIVPLSVDRQIPELVAAKQGRLAAGLVWSKWYEIGSPVGPSHLAQVRPASADLNIPVPPPTSIDCGFPGSMAMSPLRSPGRFPI